MPDGSPNSPLIEPAASKAAVEWPTVTLAVVIYSAWFALTYWHERVPLWLLVPLGAWLVCWHSSLQHEILHGHPTRNARLNRMIGYPPLTLWLPFDRYRAEHLQHHTDEQLTDPLDDPETRYVTLQSWIELGPVGRALVRAQSTLLGRLVIGPFWAIGTFLRSELIAAVANVPRSRAIWGWHILALGAVLSWLALVCGMSVWLYVSAFVIPGTSLMLIRSFAEHRADPKVTRRTAVVEDYGPLALLFLFNNLHAAHHARPHIPWYRLPAFYRANRQLLTAQERGPFYGSYGEIFRRFLVKPHDAPIHPYLSEKKAS